MQVISNEKKLIWNKRVGQYTSFISLVVLGVGMYISIKNPELYMYSFAALIVGFILSQVGIYYGNRWGRKPTIDERITTALKGMTKDHTLYHYTSPVNHLLVGPSGVWIIEPYYQKSTIEYSEGRFRQQGGGFLLGYLKIFAQEGLGRPDLEIRADHSAVWSWLKDNGITLESPDMVNVALGFFDPKVKLIPNDCPYPMVAMDNIKTAIRTYKGVIAPADAIARIKAALPAESIQ